MNIHEKYMLRCIQLGKKGLGTTAPNPMVGAVIVHKNKIIGEGYTSPYGGAHAEVNAIHSVKNKKLIPEAILYVTLEPCSHFGKTPPCTDLILEHKISEVVIGLQDPHDKVAGKGIKKLQESGCKVTVGVLEKSCRHHHRRFLSFQEKKRPYIVLKWAETSDGFIAPDKKRRGNTPQPFWISNTQSKQLAHKWRSEEQAILIGTTTALDDNPKLTLRSWDGKNPTRIVLDKNLKVSTDSNVLDATVKTIVITEIGDETKYVDGVCYELMDFSLPIAKQICAILYKHSITSVLIEGGTRTLQTFIDEGLWDEAKIFQAATTFLNGIRAPKISGQLSDKKNITSDTLSIYIND
ncbi:MAG: bifunctional diaminohydroxyphosphoribosylaminopyrimidine deaminase/5-amino-6-(5-phosphoribosylamino)uracil reductase RibD [Flavobacteriaceae bacterium]